ncbi:MAG: chemotaxis protein CheX [Deltaproteobacteria bacterium]|nr:chemotaxis protein CheX [Deltaproteobacteria bacterium]
MEKIEQIVNNCWNKVAGETSTLLGIRVQLITIDNRDSEGEEHPFREYFDSRISSRIDVAGDINKKIYLTMSPDDAIILGGKLLMIPESEIQAMTEQDQFSQNMEDAYGEIINIIAGAFTAVFEKEYGVNIPFSNSGYRNSSSLAERAFFEEDVVDSNFSASTVRLILDGREGGVICLIYPTDMLPEKYLEKSPADFVTVSLVEPGEKKEHHMNGKISAESVMKSWSDCDVLVVGDDDDEIVRLENALTGRGYSVKVLAFNDDINDFISGELKAVYLVARKIDEQALGLAIKVSGCCSGPVIAAAPEWTQEKVIKAVRYGIKDILLTPADSEDIEMNIDKNFSNR